MTFPKHTYIRPCKRCNKIFNPSGKYTRLCKDCNPHYGSQSNSYSRRIPPHRVSK